MLPKAFIQYCYNTASVSGKDYVGGILGSNGENSSILDCYNTGTVSGTNYVGGNYGSSSTYNNNCFYLVPNKGVDPSKAEKLSDEMKTSQFVYGLNRVQYGGVNAFILPPSGTVNNGYPILTSSAKAPIFATNLSGETSYYSKDETATVLSVLANVSDSGTISYQWYKNSGIKINGETNDTYTPPTATVGTAYYYVIATNTNNSANGTKTATTKSETKTVTTNEKNVNAEIPTFNTDLSGKITYTKDAIATALTVSAITSDGGTISYQWYKNSKNNTTSGTIIYKESKATYTPPTATVGTAYYYVIATNTNNSANGATTAIARSKIKTVTINADTYAVTVNSGTASPSTAAANEVVTITAITAPSGQRFKEWTIVSGGITLANTQASSTSFTMPANAVEVTATYEDIPSSTYSITVNSGTASPSTAAANEVVTITAITAPSGQRFKEWTIVSGGITLANEQASSTSFTMPSSAVEVTATYEDIPSPTYSITINSGTASPSTAAANEVVTITAITAPSGQRFKEWTIVSGGITLANAKASSTSFTMRSNDVEVTATYEDIPAGTIPVVGVTLNKNSLSLYSNVSPKTANLTATVTPADATDKSVTWQSSNPSVATVDARGKITAVGNGTAVITVITTDGYRASCTVTVTTHTSSGGSPSAVSSSGGTTTKITITKENQPNQPITAVSSVTATVGTNGTASASIPDKVVTDAISKAQEEATKQKKTENGISIGLNVTMPKGATTLTATLSQNALNSLVSAGVKSLEINGSPVTISFDQKALKEIQKQTNGNVNITIAPRTNLSETAKKIIGSRPVYNITVGHGNNSAVSSFGGGVATIAIPYTPANGEAISGLYAVNVDENENGNATRVEGSAYDANSGSVLFTTPHFSMYGVGYTAPSEKLTDISNHWAKESIVYVVDKEILSRIAETTFAPDTAMTREMLVTALGKLAEVDVSNYTTSSFTDAKGGSTSQPYIDWAYEAEIIHGIGNNEFAPDRAITREEIAVIIVNFTKATGYTLPVAGEATTYADASSIGDYYKTAVTAMQQAGIMKGGTDNKFNPKSNATRAEVSSMLHRYIQLTITSDTTAKE